MKSSFSVFLLFLRHSVWKVLLLLAAMAGIELALFAALTPDPATHSLETCLAACGRPLGIVLLMGFVSLGCLLLADGSGGKHRLSYTLDRLAVSPRAVLACQAVYNLLVWLLFGAVQAAALLGCFWLYQRQGGYVGPQTLFLTCWQNELVHSFLPMEDVLRWLRNLILALGLAVTVACASAQLRQKNKPIAFCVLVGGTMATFIQPMGQPIDVLIILLVLVITGVALYYALSLGEEEAHEEVSSD